MKLIRIDANGSPGTTLEVTGDNVVLGRSPARGVCVEDPTVSREHARIFRRGDDYQVADLNSSNGTFVNGERVTRAPLRPGDVLRLGSVELRVQSGAGAGQAPAAPERAGAVEPPPDAAEMDDIQLEEPAAPPIDATLIMRPSPPQPPARPRPVLTPARPGADRPLARKRAGGLLDQDMAQQSFGRRLLVILLALAVAAALFYAAVRVTEKVVPEGGLPPAAAPDDDGLPAEDG